MAKKIAQVRERLDNSLVASMEVSADKVLQFLGQEEDMLDQHKDRCTKLMEYQVCVLFTRCVCPYFHLRVERFSRKIILSSAHA